MNRSLSEKVWSLLSTTGLENSYWVEALTYGSHLLNRLPTTAIGGKTPLEISSGRTARDHSSLRVFGCPVYIDIKKDKLDPSANKLWIPKNKKFVSSRHVTFDET